MGLGANFDVKHKKLFRREFAREISAAIKLGPKFRDQIKLLPDKNVMASNKSNKGLGFFKLCFHKAYPYNLLLKLWLLFSCSLTESNFLPKVLTALFCILEYTSNKNEY